jgi:YNFM family putative membrane transporter
MAKREEFFRIGKAKPVETVEKANRERTALVVLCLATVAIFSNMYATQPILPEIGREFGLSPSEAGLTISSMVLAIAASAVFYGILSDRVGRRPVIIVTAFALTIPTLLCAVAPTFPILIACRIGQGLVIPGFIATTITYIHEEFHSWRGVAVGWYTAASVMGGFTGRLQGGLLTDFFNWRWVFFSFALINLLSGIALWRYLPTSQNFTRDKGQTTRRLDLSELVACFGNRRLVGAYVLGPAIFFPFIGLFTYLPYYLTRPPFNMSTLAVSFIFVVYLIGMIAAPVCGRFSDTLGRRGIMALGVLLMGTGLALTLVQALPVVFVGLLCLCFGMFTAQSTNNAYIGDSVRKGQGRGSAVSLYQLFFYTGGSFGGFVPGLLWQSSGWPLLVVGCLVSLAIGLCAVRWLCR